MQSSQDENKCFESGNVEAWADNTQRKGKTSRVWEDGTTPISIASNVFFICCNPVTHIQKIYQLSPRHWHNTKQNIPSFIQQFEQQLNANIFQPYRHKIQSTVVKNLLEGNSDTGDSIDKSLNEKCDKDLFFCMQCTAANTKTSSLCISCGCQLQTSQNRELIIVCTGVSTPPSKTPPLSYQATLKSANCPSPPFLGNPPSVSVFCELPP